MKKNSFFICSILVIGLSSCGQEVSKMLNPSEQGIDYIARTLTTGGISEDSLRGVMVMSANHSPSGLNNDSSTIFGYTLAFHQGLKLTGMVMNVGNAFVGVQSYFPKGINLNLYGVRSYDSVYHAQNFGKTIHFGFDGHTPIGLLRDSIYVPKIISIDLPNGAQTSKASGGLVVDWESDSKSGWACMLLESYNMNTDVKKSSQKILPDNGHYTIQPSDLAIFDEYSNVTVRMIRGNAKIGKTVTGESVLFITYTFSTETFKLYP